MDIVIPEGMTDAALLSVIIGFLAPLVLNFIVSATWPAWAKSLAAFVFAAVAGVLTAWITGALSGLSILSTILLILVISITSYQNFWKQIAPNLQRGSEKKAAIVVEEKDREASVIAAQAAAKVEEALPISRIDLGNLPTYDAGAAVADYRDGVAADYREGAEGRAHG